MNKIAYIVLVVAAAFSAGNLSARPYYKKSYERLKLNNNITSQIPTISYKDVVGKPQSDALFTIVPDVAEYKGADWNNVIGIAYGISEEDALVIAKSNPDITYFFRTKGGQMVLERPDGSYRAFRNGDTIFFSGTPWFSTAPGLADGYVKQ